MIEYASNLLNINDLLNNFRVEHFAALFSFFTAGLFSIAAIISQKSMKISLGRLALRKLVALNLDTSNKNYHESKLANRLISSLVEHKNYESKYLSEYIEDFIADIKFEHRLESELQQAIAIYVNAPVEIDERDVEAFLISLEEMRIEGTDASRIRAELYQLVESETDGKTQTLNKREMAALKRFIASKRLENKSFVDWFIEDRVKNLKSTIDRTSRKFIERNFERGVTSYHLKTAVLSLEN